MNVRKYANALLVLNFSFLSFSQERTGNFHSKRTSPAVVTSISYLPPRLARSPSTQDKTRHWLFKWRGLNMQLRESTCTDSYVYGCVSTTSACRSTMSASMSKSLLAADVSDLRRVTSIGGRSTDSLQRPPPPRDARSRRAWRMLLSARTFLRVSSSTGPSSETRKSPPHASRAHWHPLVRHTEVHRRLTCAP